MNKMKPSFYNHFTKLNNDEYIVFNKFHGSISVVYDKLKHVLETENMDDISTQDFEMCLDNGFIVEQNTNEQALGRKNFADKKWSHDVLNVIFELTRSCNLACPYCYQNDSRDVIPLSQELVNKIALYVKNMLETQERNIHMLRLNFIGGEPLLERKHINRIIHKFRTITEQRGVRLETKIDTNGYFLDKSLAKEFNFISVTLSNKTDHNYLRPLANGKGSFQKIIHNLASIKDVLNNSDTMLSIRFNVNHENYRHIKKTYELIENIGIERFKFKLFYTINYDYNQRVNRLSRNEYKEIYKDFLGFLIGKGSPIDDFPMPTFAVCKAYIPYNIKVFSNGKLGLCDAFMYPISNINDVYQDVTEYHNVFEKYMTYNPYDDEQCSQCSNIGICGGKYFCKTNSNTSDIDICDFLPYKLDDYLRFFVEQYPKAPHLFTKLNE